MGMVTMTLKEQLTEATRTIDALREQLGHEHTLSVELEALLNGKDAFISEQADRLALHVRESARLQEENTRIPQLEEAFRDAVIRELAQQERITQLEAFLAASRSPSSAPQCERCNMNPSRVCLGCATFASDLQPVAPSSAQGWEPIATAPKDGKRLLLHPGKHGYSVVGRRSLTNRWWESLPGKYQIAPTHWMPLPPAPGAGRPPQEKPE
jgi:hypothetical protein